MKSMQAIRVFVLLALAVPAVRADSDGNWVKMSATEDHLCFIDAEGLKCWTSQGRVPQAQIPPLTEPYELWAGGGYQCAEDATGSYCWSWSDGVVRSFPQTIGVQSLSVSKTRICYLKDGRALCLRLDGSDLSTPWEFPMITTPPSINAAQIPSRLMRPWAPASVLAGDTFACSMHSRPTQVTQQTYHCEGEILGGTDLLTDITLSVDQHPRLATARENLLCMVVDAPDSAVYQDLDYQGPRHPRLRCSDLAEKDLSDDNRDLGPLPDEVYQFLDQLTAPEAVAITGGRNVCALDGGKVYCGLAAVSDDPDEKNWIRDMLGKRYDPYLRPLEEVGNFVSAQKLVPYQNGICALDESRIKCWDLLQNRALAIADDFKDLDYLDFRLEAFEKTLRTLSRFAYHPKKECLLDLSAMVETLALPTDGTVDKPMLEKRLFLFQLAAPLLETIDTQRFQSFLVLYHRKLAQYNLEFGVKTLRDFPDTPQYRGLALTGLASALRVAKELSQDGTDQETLVNLVGATGLALVPSSPQGALTTLKNQMEAASPLFQRLAGGENSRGVGLLLLELSDYIQMLT